MRGPIAKASFNLLAEVGDELPDVNALLGIAPDFFDRRGDIPAWGGRPWARDAWYLHETEELRGGGDFAGAVLGCLRRLVKRLMAANAAERLRDAGLTGSASNTVHGFCRNLRDSNMVYDPELVQALAELGIPLEEDFYELAE